LLPSTLGVGTEGTETLPAGYDDGAAVGAADAAGARVLKSGGRVTPYLAAHSSGERLCWKMDVSMIDWGKWGFVGLEG
jgi:hypothetical protein